MIWLIMWNMFYVRNSTRNLFYFVITHKEKSFFFYFSSWNGQINHLSFYFYKERRERNFSMNVRFFINFAFHIKLIDFLMWVTALNHWKCMLKSNPFAFKSMIIIATIKKKQEKKKKTMMRVINTFLFIYLNVHIHHIQLYAWMYNHINP
jgi:hypothetical protein